MGGKGSGKRPKLTRAVHDTIVRHLKTGAFMLHAADAARVSRWAVAEWMKRGEAGEARYVAFYEDVRALQGEDALRLNACVTRAALVDRDWKAAAYMLERKYPKQYGRAAIEAIGVVVGPEGKSDDPDAPQRTRVEFYLPVNGRRPDDEEQEP